MTDLLSSSQFWLLVSIGFYALGVEIQKKTGSAVCNPLLIASILVGALPTGTPYQTYEESGKLISFFLTPATVALAIPIYRKLDVLLKNLLPILLGAFVGSMVSIGSVLLFSHLFGLSESTTLSLVPKSVTTPIAVAVAEMLGGVTSITAIAVVITGIIGAIILPTFLKCIGVRNPVQMGLSIGTAAHAVGTSRAIELGETEGAISGLAIGVAGLLTACRRISCSWASQTTATTGRCPMCRDSRAPAVWATCRPSSRRFRSVRRFIMMTRHSLRTTTTGATVPSTRSGLRMRVLSAPSWRLPENISWQASASGILCGIFRSCGLC